jgi:rhodanese-related sulfurtransferase
VEALKAQFPKYKKAAIILYNQDGNLAAAKDPFKAITGWGYKQVTVLGGGFKGWEKAGKKVAKGPAESKIAFVRKLLPGEMDVVDFKALLAKPDKGVVIVDVRTPAETKVGTLPNAVPIPLEEIEANLAKLPKDKPLIIHCSTGVRAEMAYNVLKKAGFKPKYVKAVVKFDKEKKGEYTVSD